MKARMLGRPAHAAASTGNGKTAQSYIAGIGASGALLAGAVVTFVFLVGAVSFEVWPTVANQNGGDDSLGVAELAGPSAGGASATTTAPSFGAAIGQLADAIPTPSPAAPKAGDGVKGGPGSGDQSPSTGDTGEVTVPPTTGSGDGTGNTSDAPGGGGSGGSGSSGSSGSAGGGSNGPSGGGTNGSGRPNTGTSTGTSTGTAGSGSTGSSGSSGGSSGGGSNHSSRG